MIDKEMINKILTVSATKEEVVDFALKIMRAEFDKVDSFNKYYSRKTFEILLEKYKNKEIDASYVSYWSHCYTFLLMSEVWIDSADRDLYPIEVVMYKISDYLDEMYFVEQYDFCAFEKVVKNVFVADKIYKMFCEGKSIKTIVYLEPLLLNIVYVNEEEKIFAMFEMLIEEGSVIDAEQMEKEEFMAYIEKLKSLGYKDLHN